MRFSIRKITLFGICLGTLLFFACFFLLQRLLLEQEFSALEIRSVALDVARAANAIKDEEHKLDDLVVDWAIWDDTCAFMSGNLESYVTTNLNERSIAALRLAVILFLREDGSLAWAQSFDEDGKYQSSPPEDLLDHLGPHCPLREARRSEDRIKGLLSLPQGILLTASSPILDSEGRGPARGTLIMGRRLTPNLIADIAGRTRLDVAFEPASQPLPDDLAHPASPPSTVDAVTVAASSDTSVAGWTVLPDIDGRPALRVIVRQPRAIVLQGKAVVNRMGLVLAVGGLLLLGFIVLFVERRVLARLANLRGQVDALAAPGAFPGQVHVAGADELSILADRVNAMVGELETSRTALAANEAYLRRIIDSLPIGIFQATPEGLCRLANPSLARMMGFDSPEAMLRTGSYFRSYYLDPMAYEFIRVTLETRGSVSDHQVQVRRNDGRVIWISTSVMTIHNAQGDVASFIGFVQDITRRREAEAEILNHQENLEHLVAERTAKLQEEVLARTQAQEALLVAKTTAENANRAKSEFLANMSHEIRTPLNGVLGMLQLLAETALDADQRECLEMAVQAADRLTGLLSDILDLSRVEADKLTLREEPFSLADLRQSVLALFRTAAMKKGIQLDFMLDARLTEPLIGDEARLRQILFNLVGNALKFTDKGRVAVDVRPLADTPEGMMRLLFTVSDTGVGIPDDQLASILDPFVQAERTYTRHYQGAGLGLSIVRRLVLLMGGTLAIDNGGEEDRGTIICVALPFARAKHLPGEGDDADAVQASPHPARILVVEDDPVSLDVTRRALDRAGHTVVTAENGDQALDLLAREPFDLLLVDVQLPVRNGLDTVAALRQAKDLAGENARIPAIAITAYAMAGDKEKILAAGMNAYLPKPLDLRALLVLINHVRKAPGQFPAGGPA